MRYLHVQMGLELTRILQYNAQSGNV
jgi:hypothetical protein